MKVFNPEMTEKMRVWHRSARPAMRNTAILIVLDTETPALRASVLLPRAMSQVMMVPVHGPQWNKSEELSGPES